MDKHITVGNKGYEVTYIYNDKQQAITGEILPSGTIVDINLNMWSSPDGNVNRYYVSRGGKKIGWIAQELDKCNGNSSTEQHWVNNIMMAMQQAKNAD